jgi:hypothetical protein
MSQEFHKFWLKITAVVVASFAPIFFLGAIEALSEPARFITDLLSWPLDGNQSFAEPTTRFVSAVTGGLLLGWGVMIWLLSGSVYDAAPEGVRRVVLIGLLSWFVLDSAGSILSGNTSNAVFNVLVLLVAVGPMWRPATRLP